MAYQVVWTQQAIQGFDKIIVYLSQNFTEREKSNKAKDVHRGPINKLTIVAYRVKRRKKQIEILHFRSTRQKPLKSL